MDKIFKASLVELESNEIIYLIRNIRFGKLPNGAVDTIISGVASVPLTMTKQMIMIKLTRMEKAKKSYVAAPTQAQFMVPFELAHLLMLLVLLVMLLISSRLCQLCFLKIQNYVRLQLQHRLLLVLLSLMLLLMKISARSASS